MISLKELNPKGFLLSDVQAANVPILHERINLIRTAYGKPMLVTSGVRSVEDHRRIYLAKAKAAGKSPDSIRIPMGSMHLKGAAVDIYDPKQELQTWCKANEKLLAEVGLWMEDFSATPTWCHFQIYPPHSGKRWFLP